MTYMYININHHYHGLANITFDSCTLMRQRWLPTDCLCQWRRRNSFSLVSLSAELALQSPCFCVCASTSTCALCSVSSTPAADAAAATAAAAAVAATAAVNAECLLLQCHWLIVHMRVLLCSCFSYELFVLFYDTSSIIIQLHAKRLQYIIVYTILFAVIIVTLTCRALFADATARRRRQPSTTCASPPRRRSSRRPPPLPVRSPTIT